MAQTITIEIFVNAAPEKVYDAFLNPEDLIQWHHASEGWTTPYAKIDAVEGGRFAIAYQDPAGKYSFDYTGTYSAFQKPNHIAYNIDDGRAVTIDIRAEGQGSKVVQTFEMESINSEERQREGWAAQLDNLKLYLEK